MVGWGCCARGERMYGRGRGLAKEVGTAGMGIPMAMKMGRYSATLECLNPRLLDAMELDPHRHLMLVGWVFHEIWLVTLQ